jgi:hypothetical protein
VKDLRTITSRQLIVVWITGLVFATGMLFASLRVQRQVLHSMARPMARRAMLSANRVRELDSLYSQYALAHPDDRSARAQAAQRRAERVAAERRDFLNRAVVRKAQIDTVFDARAESEQSWLLRLSGLGAAFVLLALGTLTPVAIIVLTLVWGVHRARRRRMRTSA